MRYDFHEGQIYRPPSEAGSLIVQITTGCSYNRCSYCSMFKTKRFKIKDLPEIREALGAYRREYGSVQRIFLADGDAMAIPFDGLMKILDSVSEYFPENERTSTYASFRNLAAYTDQQVTELRKHGLGLLYMGVESGSDGILANMQKGQSTAMMLEGAEKVRKAGMVLSASVICGLGGRELARENALRTAEVINAIDPRYLGILRLTIDPGTPLERKYRDGLFIPQSEYGIIQEMHTLIANLELSNCIVRSNHVCNYVNISGTLGKDKKKMLGQLNFHLASINPDRVAGNQVRV
jgi:radical SAM superfamily enzyme YgiQ (UPF0313 family)